MNLRSIRHLKVILILFCAVTKCCLANEAGELMAKLSWQAVTPENKAFEPYLDGAFVGSQNEVLIIAGGKAGNGLTSNTIGVLFRDASGCWQWQTSIDTHLPEPLSHGATISTENGIICLGGVTGRNGRVASNAVVRVSWDLTSRSIAVERMPDLPVPLSHAGAALVGSHVYIAGGNTGDEEEPGSGFYSIDLSAPDIGWQVLQTWPGSGIDAPLAVSQHDGRNQCLYLFSGYDPLGNFRRVSCKYDPGTGFWTKISKLPGSRDSLPDYPGSRSAVPYGESHILFFKSGMHAEKDLTAWAYHTITDTWVKTGPAPGLGTHHFSVPSGDRIFVVQESAGREQAKATAYTVEVQPPKRSFGLINSGVFSLYLIILVGMGIYLARRAKNTDDFFLGGHRIPSWAAGVSILGTQLSSISFMAIPAQVYAANWQYYPVIFCIIAVQPVIIFFYLPFFRRLNVTSAYEYLEKRFNLAARLYTSVSFVLFQVGRMTIVLYLPSLAFSAVTGIDIYLCILLMGVLATFYTVMGGIEAVVWSDVIQVVVLFGGALLSLVIILTRLGGPGEVLETSAMVQKFKMAQWGWDWTMPVLWVVVIGNLFSNFMTYSSDQAVIQRYLTTRNEKAAAGSIWTNAALTLPVSTIWFLLGTALFVFYKKNPHALDPTLMNDQVFPLFIAQELPVGLAGLVISGLTAASMSTVDSSLNSIATAISTDFVRRFGWYRSEIRYLRMARILTVLFGCVAIGACFWIAGNPGEVEALWDVFMRFLGLVMGGMAGLFALGIFTKRARGTGSIIGALTSAVLLWYVQAFTDVHYFLYAVVGVCSCFIIGYLASLFQTTGKKSIEGLTYYTIRKLK